MKKCVIFANCQADGLAHFLRKAGFPYEIKTYLNHQLILGEASPEALKRDAAECDLFIFQPTREMKHGPLSSEYYIEKVIPRDAQTIAFPYLFNHGFFPLVGHGDGFMGADEMDPKYWKMDRDFLLAAYDVGAIDFALMPRLLACAAEQSKRELQCGIRLADFIVDNRFRHLFLNFNHPSSILFARLAQEVMEAISDEPMPPIEWDHINEARLPCALPLSRYVIDEFNMKVVTESPGAHAYYRNFLSLAWQRKQSIQQTAERCARNS